MIIKILGSGCNRCEKLFKKVNDVVRINNLNAEVLKIEDIKEIMRYGIMMTPALVVDGTVISVGKVLNKDEIKKILTK